MSREAEPIRSLSQRERAEAVSWLGEGLGVIAESINREAGFAFTDASCRVSMDAFSGVYDKRMRKDDRKIVMANRLHSSGIEDLPAFREAAAAGHANPSENAAIEALLVAREEEAKKSDGQLAEAVATVVLHRAIGKRFLVARASEYDDYVHGVDMLVVDKETGETVCAFDEVVDAVGADGNDADAERYRKKVARSKKSIREHGGMRVKYGATYSGAGGASKMELAALDRVPTFCLSLDRAELYGLVLGMTRGTGEMNATEELFLRRLVGKLEAQEQDFRTSGFGGEADRLGRFRTILRDSVPDRAEKGRVSL